MNELQVFSNDEFGSVRTVVIENEPWFVGKDVADILGYSNSRKAIADHVDEEDKGVTICDTLGGKQEMTVINESGLYALVFGSKLPSAKRFKHWVTSEILPTIRKTGSYNAKPMSQLDILVESAKALQAHERELARLRMDNEEIRKEQEIQSSRIDTLNCVCTEGTKRQKLVKMVQAYAQKNGITYDRAWREFKTAYNTAFHTNISLSRNIYAEKNGLKKKPSTPEFLEIKDLLDDALRIADKLLNGKIVA